MLGAIAPIEAMTAATVVARFLFRLDAFLPALGVPMNWTEIMTGMLRISYITDILRKFEQIHDMPSFSSSNCRSLTTLRSTGTIRTGSISLPGIPADTPLLELGCRRQPADVTCAQ